MQKRSLPLGFVLGLALALIFGGAATDTAHAQGDVLIEVQLPRTDSGAPVFQRAILTRPNADSTTALLYFRGGHGMAKISSLNDKRLNLPLFIGPLTADFFAAGISLVVMDCPTDQWGPTDPSNRATSCLDAYRSSAQHADDVRTILAHLREDHGYTRLFIMGHSKGTLSSRWLAVHLGKEIAGSIHSGSLAGADTWGNGDSVRRIKYAEIAAPVLHIHHRDDACPVTPYSGVKRYSTDNLVTVRGGIAGGHMCGGGHFHSFQGREAAVARAIIDWISTGKVTPVVGE